MLRKTGKPLQEKGVCVVRIAENPLLIGRRNASGLLRPRESVTEDGRQQGGCKGRSPCPSESGELSDSGQSPMEGSMRYEQRMRKYWQKKLEDPLPKLPEDERIYLNVPYMARDFAKYSIVGSTQSESCGSRVR